MDEKKKQRLEKAGWKVGTVTEFLDLTPEEEAYVEMRLALADALRELRQEHQLTQTQLAERLGSSQSRVAKMEGGDPSVSLDLVIRSLLALGASRDDVATWISSAEVRKSA